MRRFFALTILIVLAGILPASGEEGQVRLQGRVVDADARPVAGARVELYEGVWSSGKLEAKLHSQTETDGQGKFVFSLPAAEITRRLAFDIVAGKDGYAIGWLTVQPAFDVDGDITVILDAPVALAGVVVDEDGAPVPGAEVKAALTRSMGQWEDLIGGGGAFGKLTAVTDAKGAFTVSGIPAAATAAFTVSAKGKATVSMQGAAKPETRITLPAEAVIEGRVVEKETGKGIEGVTIRAMAWGAGNETAAADKDGHFRIENLAEGEYTLTPVRPMKGDPEWCPSSTKITALAGKTTGAVKIELEKGSVLEVDVPDAQTGKPVREAYVAVYAGNVYAGSGYTDEEGRVIFRLAPGNYNITRVNREGYKAPRARIACSVAAGQTQHLAVNLEPLPVMTGTVSDDKGAPLAGASVMVMGAGFSGRVRTTEGGSFKVRWYPVDTEDRTVYVFARAAERNLAAKFAVSDPSQPATVKAARAKTIRGRVLNPQGEPLRWASMQLSFIDSRGKPNIVFGTVFTDKEGVYEIKGVLDDARYEVVAGVAGYGQKAVEVGFAETNQDTLEAPDITLPLANKAIAGVVVNENDRPLAHVYVYAYSPGQLKMQTVLTDKEGKFRIGGLPEGQVRLSANAQDRDLTSGEVQAKTGQEDVKVVMRKIARPTEPVPEPKAPEPLVGKVLPDLKALNTDVRWTAPADASKEKPVLVCFLDRHQRPSRNAAESLARKKDALRERGVVVFLIDVSVRSEEEKRADSIADAKGEASFPRIYLDEKAEETKFAWGVKSLPWLILADKEHVVRGEGFGVDELDSKLGEITGK